MSFDSMTWFDASVLQWLGISLILNGCVAYLWHKKFYSKLGLRTYHAIQRIHLNETPRLGGFIFILSIMGFVTQWQLGEGANILRLILMSLIPCILVALREDFFHDVDPTMRLLPLIFVG